MTLNAQQLVYTRVEPAYSPKRKSGYQTVYRPASLAETDIAAIEKRVQCFSGGRQGTVRYQSFPLADDHWVISHTCVIDSNREITDKTRRGGVFLVHCLILSRQQFLLAGADPFAVIDTTAFLDDAESMVEALGPGGGEAPAITLSLVTKMPKVALGWSDEAIKAFFGEVARAKTTVNKAQSLLLIGESKTIEDTLRAVMTLATGSAARLHCSFDSHIDRCSVHPGAYWAVGTSRRYEIQRGFIPMDTVAGTIEGHSSGTTKTGNDLYSRWIDSQNSMETMLERAPSVQPLCEALEGQRGWDPTSGEDSAIEDFYHGLGREIVASRMERDLKPWLGPKVRQALKNDLMSEQYPIRQQLRLAMEPVTPSLELAECLCVLVSRDRPRLPASEWRKLQKFACQTEHWLLLHRAAALLPYSNRKACDHALAHMDEVAFAEALKLLGNPISAVDFVSERHLASLLQTLDLSTLTAEDYFQLVRRILQLGCGEKLATLVAPIEGLSTRQVCNLYHLLNQYHPCTESFRQAIMARIKPIANTLQWFLFCSITPYSEGKTKDA